MPKTVLSRYRAAMYKLARHARRLVEGALFLSLCPAWVLLGWAGSVRNRRVGSTRGAWACALRRWWDQIANGLEFYRKNSWVHWKLEALADIWFHILTIEMFSALNLGRSATRSGQLSRGGRVLVIKLGHFGDALHIMPMVKGLIAKRPDLHVDLLVGPWGAFLGDKINGLARVLVYSPRYAMFNRGTRAAVRGWFGEMAFLLSLRSRRYDTVISTSTTNLPELLILQAAAPNQWIGCSSEIAGRYPQIPGYVVPYDSKAYEADRVCRLLAGVGVDILDGQLAYPIPDAAAAWASRMRQEWSSGASRKLVCISPGAGWPGKQWPAERFALLATALRDGIGAFVVILGGPDERILTKQVSHTAGPGIIDLGGQTTLDQLAALIKAADLFIGNDSGPMHLAAAVGTPCLSLFGPTVASKWAPRSTRSSYLQKSFDCAGCLSWHPNAACLHDRACMRLIEVDEVVRLARTLLGRD